MRHEDFLEHLLWLLTPSELKTLCDEYEIADHPKQRETIQALLATSALQTLQDCLLPLTRTTLQRICVDLGRGIDTSLSKKELLSFMAKSLSKFTADTWKRYAPIPALHQSFTHESEEAPIEQDLQEIGKKRVPVAREEPATQRTLAEMTQLPLEEVKERLQRAHGNSLVSTVFEDVWPELETAVGIQQAIDEDRRSSGVLDVVALPPPPPKPETYDDQPQYAQISQEGLSLHTLLRDFHQHLDEIESIHAYKYQEGRPVVTRYTSRGSEIFGIIDAAHNTNPITHQQLSSLVDRLKTYRKRDVRYITYLACAFTAEALAWLSERKVLSEYIALYEITPKGFVIRHNKRKRILLWTLLERFLHDRMPLLDSPVIVPIATISPASSNPSPDAMVSSPHPIDPPAPSASHAPAMSPSSAQPLPQPPPSAPSNPSTADDFHTGGGLAPPPKTPPIKAPTPHALPSLGESLDGGRYRLEKLLGQGGMGRVFAAYDQLTKRHCALKLIHPHLAQDPKIKERFLHEISVLHTLQHPSIVRSYDIKEDSQRSILFYTMEWIDGISLSEKLHLHRKEIPPLPLQESFAILEALTDAFDYIHKEKVVHRDLKPANVMLTAHGQIKLMDFGIAVTFSHTHAEAYTSAAGTPNYLAPEQLTEGSEVSPAADIFALGVLAFHLLTGAYPPRHRKPEICRYLPQASSTLDDVIQRATDDDPTQRYPSAKAFWQDASAVWPHETNAPSPKLSETSHPSEVSEHPQYAEKSESPQSPEKSEHFQYFEVSEPPESPEPPNAISLRNPPPSDSDTSETSTRRLPQRAALLALGLILLFGSGFGVWFARACPKGQTRCDGQCVALAKESQHCGKCGINCNTAFGFSCKDGQCACSSGQIACEGRCVDTQTQTKHCGRCGQICPIGATCEAGHCRCPRSQTVCAGSCVELQKSANHCGKCGKMCALGCEQGTCKKRQQISIAVLPKASAQRVEAGQFVMGLSKKQLPSATYYESPPVQVSIQRPFWIWKTEVTQAQFERVVGYNPSRFKTCGTSCPVEQVTWHEAAFFCNRLSILEKREICFDCTLRRGRVASCAWKQEFLPPRKRSKQPVKTRSYTSCKGWRLPTEAEWEYAAHGGHKATDGSVILAPDTLFTLAWVKENSTKQPHPVAQKQPNTLGLFDILGNLREWTAEAIQRYPKTPQIDPQSPPRGSVRVARGGSWYENARSIRITKRASVSAAYQKVGDTGFRPVRTLDNGE